MIRHIVLWKLDSSYSSEEKKMILADFRSRLLRLEEQVQALVSLEVYLCAEGTPATNFDIMLDTTFNTGSDLTAYQDHPDHQQVVAFVKTLKLQRAAIDFSF